MRAKSWVGVSIAAVVAVTAGARGQTVPVAEHLTPRPADLTRIRERNGGEFPVTAVHDAIAGGKPVKGHGTSEMPVWGEAFRQVMGGQTPEDVEERIGQLVAYLRSIQTPPAK